MPPSARQRLPSINEIESGLKNTTLSQTSSEESVIDRQRSQKISAVKGLDTAPPKPGSGKQSQKSQSVGSSGKVQSTDSENPAGSRHSCSSFAARSVTIDLTADGTLVSWLIERSIIRVALYTFTFEEDDKLTKIKRSINNKVAFYNKISEFPNVGIDVLMKYRMPPHLEAWHDILRNKYQSALHQSKSSAKLDPDLQSLLGDRIYDILKASSSSAHLNRVAKECAVLEAQYRHPWDELLSSFAINDIKAVVSSGVLLERTINLPRNPSLDVMKDNQPVHERYLAIAKLSGLLWQEVVENLPRGKTEEGAAATAALREANEIEKRLDILDEAAINAAIVKHSSVEPLHAKADALFVTPIALPDLISSKPYELQRLIHKAGLIRYSPPAGDHSPSDRQSPSASSKLATTTPVARKNTETPPRGNYQSKDPSTALSSLSLSDEVSAVALDDNSDVSNAEYHFRFASLAAEYKKLGKTFAQALNQARIYLASSVAFMHALGISDYAVFGLVTTGSIGSLIMCWHEKTDTQDQAYMLDTNVKTFDISIPTECLHLASIFLRLAKFAPEITKTLDLKDVEGKFFAISKGDVSSWTKEEQANEYEENIKKKTGSKSGKAPESVAK